MLEYLERCDEVSILEIIIVGVLCFICGMFCGVVTVSVCISGHKMDETIEELESLKDKDDSNDL